MIIILNKSKLGVLIQYPPYLFSNDKKNMINNFFIEVEAFPENDEALNNILQNPPDWLLERGDLSQQKNHLEKQVLININKRLEFSKNKNFEGYVIRTKPIFP